MTHLPEQKLWHEVLLRQVEDALHGPTGVNGKAHRIAVVEAARALLTKRSQSLTTLCYLAGMEPDAVVSAMRKKIGNAPSPAELAGGTRTNRASLIPRPDKPKAKLVKYEDRLITYSGKTLTMREWSERTGIPVKNIATRLRQDWSIERALTQPMGKRNRGWGATGAANLSHAPGVGSNFRRIEGTGGGRSAQGRPKISFSPNEKIEA